MTTAPPWNSPGSRPASVRAFQATGRSLSVWGRIAIGLGTRARRDPVRARDLVSAEGKVTGCYRAAQIGRFWTHLVGLDPNNLNGADKLSAFRSRLADVLCKITRDRSSRANGVRDGATRSLQCVRLSGPSMTVRQIGHRGMSRLLQASRRR